MTRQSEVGQLGENTAVRYLKKNRYKIIDRNYRERWGEIDIIALSPEKILVFVEVKTVSGPNPYIKGEDHLTKTKLAKLQKTAQFYANGAGSKFVKGAGWQIDLLAITINGDSAVVNHYKNI